MLVKRIVVLTVSMILAAAGWAAAASADAGAATRPTGPTTAGVTPGSDKDLSTQGYSCGYYSGTALTQYGDTGSRVREVQCLINLGYYTPKLTVDGAFGAKTRDAVKWYQRCSGIAVDGIVGPDTWYQLRNNPYC